MTTVKSPIFKGLGVTASTLYTNSTAGSATLKAVNAVGSADASAINVTTGGSEWGFFGHTHPVFQAGAASTATETPFAVRLSANRILLLTLPHNQHVGGGADTLGGNVVHAQICEYQTNKYVSAPIVNVPLPSAMFSVASASLHGIPSGMTSTYGQTLCKAVALTPTKVVVGFRVGTAFWLLKLKISGNSVDLTSVASLGLTGASYFNTTTAGAFDLCVVPGDTNQVLVGGFAGGSNWSVQAYSVPDTGAISSASTLFSLGMTQSTLAFAMTNLASVGTVGQVSYYVAAGQTSATALGIQNFSYAAGTNTFTLVGNAVSTTVSSCAGVHAACVSSGSSANAVIGFVESVAAGTVKFLRQTSNTQANNAVNNLAVANAATTKSLVRVFQWGSERAVFVGEGNIVFSVDSAGVGTDLIGASNTTNTTLALNQWFPFDSRPLYTFYDPNVVNTSRVCQYYARAGATGAVSVGTLEVLGNYFPHGHNYGGQASWSEVANCFIVGFGGRLYALDSTGLVLSEAPLTSSMGFTALLTNSIHAVSVAPSGRIFFMTDCFGTHPSYSNNVFWVYTLNGFVATTQPVLSATELSRFGLSAPASQVGLNSVCDLVSFTDAAGVERAVGLGIHAVTNAYVGYVQYDGVGWGTITDTGVLSAALGAWNYGKRANFRLSQELACDSYNPQGVWKIRGSLGTSSAANMSALSTGSAGYSLNNLGSASMAGSTDYTSYAATVSRSSGVSVVAQYSPASAKLRAYVSVNGRNVTDSDYGWSPSSSLNTNQFVQAAATKWGWVLGTCNTTTSAVSATWYAFSAENPLVSSVSGLTSVGNGWVSVFPLSRTRVQVFGFSADAVYNVVSGKDTVRLSIGISDSSGEKTISVTNPLGQEIAANGSFRAKDTYLIPPGYSVKGSASVANALDVMLTVVEEV